MAMEEIKPDDYKGFFPITANFNERTQLFYRKYAAGFMQIAAKAMAKGGAFEGADADSFVRFRLGRAGHWVEESSG